MFGPVSKDLITQLSAILVKVVTESVRGKALRAGLIGAIAAAAFYAQDAPPPVVSDPTAAQAVPTDPAPEPLQPSSAAKAAAK